MTTVKITPMTEEDELFCHYSGQYNIQDAVLTLDLEDGELTAQYNPEIGTGIPASVYHGRTRWIPLPGPLTNEAANALLEEAAPLAQRILDGSDIDWDGNNHVATLDADAHQAEEDLVELAGSYDDPSYLIGEVEAADWFSEGDEPAGVTADSTDDELATIGAREAAAARTCGAGVTIVAGMVAYLTALRQEKREKVYAELARVRDQFAEIGERRDALVAQVRGWGVDSLRDIGEMAGLSHTHIKRLTEGGEPGHDPFAVAV
jgi:hypothetical protein